MDRFVGAPIEQFELLFEQGGQANIDVARYPPCCWAEAGPLRFRRSGRDGLAIDVRRSALRDGGHFRLELLFTTGTCMFGSPADLARFWNEIVADAFGLPRKPAPELHGESLPQHERRSTAASSPAPPNVRAERVEARSALLDLLVNRVRGQGPALEAIASLVSSHLAKGAPRRPATALLLGPPGVGKTRIAEWLPEALRQLGHRNAHLFRIDCNELVSHYDSHRFLGATLGLVGFDDQPPLIKALQAPPCVLLLDEFDRAHEAVQSALYGLLGEGHVMSPAAGDVRAPETIILLTSNAGADELAARLHRVAPENYLAADRIARTHLAEVGWPAELVSRIDTISIFRPVEGGMTALAKAVVIELAAEYELTVSRVPNVLAETVLDMLGDSDGSARSVCYAARRLLAPALVAAVEQGLTGGVRLRVGPPLQVVPDRR